MILNANSLLEDLPRINREQENAIADEFPQYAFYERIKNGVEYYCTSCHRWQKNSSDMRTFSVPAIWKHNQLYTCPYCGKQVVAKSAGQGHKTLKNKGHFIVYTAYKQRLYAFVIKLINPFAMKSLSLIIILVINISMYLKKIICKDLTGPTIAICDIIFGIL